jgi:hypothetical protein
MRAFGMFPHMPYKLSFQKKIDDESQLLPNQKPKLKTISKPFYKSLMKSELQLLASTTRTLAEPK